MRCLLTYFIIVHFPAVISQLLVSFQNSFRPSLECSNKKSELLELAERKNPDSRTASCPTCTVRCHCLLPQPISFYMKIGTAKRFLYVYIKVYCVQQQQFVFNNCQTRLTTTILIVFACWRYLRLSHITPLLLKYKMSNDNFIKCVIFRTKMYSYVMTPFYWPRYVNKVL